MGIKTTKQAGSEAEQKVAEELVRRGFEVMFLNWTDRKSEIDIVAKKGGVLIFVEVKFRSSAEYGSGLDYVTERKLVSMQIAADRFVHQNKWRGGYELYAAEVDNEGGINIIPVF
jgi:putative endonuclease